MAGEHINYKRYTRIAIFGAYGRFPIFECAWFLQNPPRDSWYTPALPDDSIANIGFLAVQLFFHFGEIGKFRRDQWRYCK